MGKKNLVISTSPRMGGNSETLAEYTLPGTPELMPCGQMHSDKLRATRYAFRDIYLLATSADEEETAMDGAVKGLEGWISCFEQAYLAGVIRGVGTDKKGEIEKFPDILNAAYELGKNVN